MGGFICTAIGVRKYVVQSGAGVDAEHAEIFALIGISERVAVCVIGPDGEYRTIFAPVEHQPAASRNAA